MDLPEHGRGARLHGVLCLLNVFLELRVVDVCDDVVVRAHARCTLREYEVFTRSHAALVLPIMCRRAWYQLY